eukprot:364559-Chlamydomonas_euryale.AAC.3
MQRGKQQRGKRGEWRSATKRRFQTRRVSKGGASPEGALCMHVVVKQLFGDACAAETSTGRRGEKLNGKKEQRGHTGRKGEKLNGKKEQRGQTRAYSRNSAPQGGQTHLVAKQCFGNALEGRFPGVHLPHDDAVGIAADAHVHMQKEWGRSWKDGVCGGGCERQGELGGGGCERQGRLWGEDVSDREGWRAGGKRVEEASGKKRRLWEGRSKGREGEIGETIERCCMGDRQR